MKFFGNTNEYLQLRTIGSKDSDVFNEIIEGSLTVLWFQTDSNILIIDGKEYKFKKNEIVFLTEFNNRLSKDSKHEAINEESHYDDNGSEPAGLYNCRLRLPKAGIGRVKEHRYR